MKTFTRLVDAEAAAANRIATTWLEVTGKVLGEGKTPISLSDLGDEMAEVEIGLGESYREWRHNMRADSVAFQAKMIAALMLCNGRHPDVARYFQSNPTGVSSYYPAGYNER